MRSTTERLRNRLRAYRPHVKKTPSKGISRNRSLAYKPCLEPLEDRTLLSVFSVDVNAPWQDTGIDVVQGQRLDMVTDPSHRVRLGFGGLTPTRTTTADGIGDEGVPPGTDGTLLGAPNWNVPGAVIFSLVGKIGGTTAFGIGTGTPVPEGKPGKGPGFVGSSYDQEMTTSGRLFLGYNDDVFGDNAGSFAVTITVTSPSDLAATNLELTQGGADLTYEITGSQLSQDTEAILYWANGPDEADILQSAAAPITISQNTPLDTPITHTFADTDISPAPNGATHLVAVVDANNLIDEGSNEDNNTVSLAIPDLVGSEFNYQVVEDEHPDESKRLNGPLPTNGHFVLNGLGNNTARTTIKNIGAGDAPAFNVAVYASKDVVFGDAGDVLLHTQQINGLAAGAEGHVVVPELQLQQPVSWTGKIYIGLVIDPDDYIAETDETNNSSQGIGVDHAQVQLYDAVPSETVIPRVFRSRREARRYLFRHRFLPVPRGRWVPPPGAGSGWFRWLSPRTQIVSAFDGQTRRGYAYRMNAFIQPRATDGYQITIQGNSSIAEPDPIMAFFMRWRDPAWFDYVKDWHARF